jgi:hypothetical protein
MTLTENRPGTRQLSRDTGTGTASGQGRLAVTLAILLGAAGLAVGLVAGLGWFAASLPGWQATAGPDYPHDTAADAAENAACNWTAVTYDQWRCGLYLQEYGAREAYRLPRDQGGVCPLATRFGCADRYGLQQWDQDVPVWAPWYLHNGRAGMLVNAAGGALLGLTVAGAVTVMGGARRASRVRMLTRGTGAALSGAAAGMALFTLGRHPLPGPVPGLPVWAAPVVTVVVVVLLARAARRPGDTR